MPGNRIVYRSELEALCESLGHDPKRVKQITIKADRVVVEYHHLVMPDPKEG